MLRRVGCLLFAVLAACAATPDRMGAESAGGVVGSPPWSRLSAPARLFIVSGRVLPVGVATCRSAARHAEAGAGGVSRDCDFVVVLDPDRNLPAIASQTTLPDGRPLVAFSHAMVEGAANADELAFVLGHEVAHHVADHAPRQIARIDEAAAGAGRTLVAEGDEASAPASLSRAERPALGGTESRASLRGFEL